MRTLVFIAALTAMAAVATPGQAQPGQNREIGWCLRYPDGGDDCMYYTYAQCLATLSGQYGECVRNPFAAYGYQPYGYEQPRRHRRHHAH
jgi:hypothetical protein